MFGKLHLSLKFAECYKTLIPRYHSWIKVKLSNDGKHRLKKQGKFSELFDRLNSGPLDGKTTISNSLQERNNVTKLVLC